MSTAVAVLLPAVHDDEVVAAVRQFESSRARCCTTRAAFLADRERAARLLAAKHAALAQDGEFKAWLESKNIARATAYRLLAALQPPKPKSTNKLTCLTETRTPASAPPLLRLDGLALTLQLAPGEAAALRKSCELHPNSAAWVLNVTNAFVNSLIDVVPPPQRQEMRWIVSDGPFHHQFANVATLPPLVIAPAPAASRTRNPSGIFELSCANEKG